MVSRILFSILLLLSPLASGQTLTPLEFSGPIRPDYVAPGAGDKFVRAGDLDGAYVKTATFASNTLTLTTQLANNSSATVTVPITSTPAANSITAAQARASTAAFQREWKNRIGIPDDWSEIANGTAISLGKVVEHGGAYFGAITAHSKSSTGPDGDAANWILLSNFYGAWANAWYPAGSFVTRSGLPYVANSAVVRNDPAPDAAANTKWLQLGSLPPSVVSGAINANIPASANGHTYILTGSTARTFFLPNASGTGEVPNAWEVVLGNRSSAILTVTPNGSDRINGNASLSVPAGEAVKLQKFSTSNWLVIADTGKGGSGGGGLNQSQVDARVLALRSLVTATTEPSPSDRLFFSNESAVGDPLAYGTVEMVVAKGTTDDAILDLADTSRMPSDRGKFLGTSASNENDIVLLDAPTGGGGGTIADNSILPAKAQAGTEAQKKAWRARLASSRIGQVSAALPAVTDYNTGDLLIIGRGGTTTVTFVNLDAPSTQLTTTVAGDLIMVLSNRWTRVGNLFSGGIAAAAAQLQLDTVIKLNDVLVANKIDGQNLEFSIQHPANAYSGANTIAVNVSGTQHYGAVAYNPASTHQTIQVGLSATALRNIANNNGLDAGDFVRAQVAFQTGTNSASAVFNRDIYIPVRPAISRTLTAKAATAGASRVWTYTLDTADTEIWIGTTARNGSNPEDTGYFTTFIPRAILSATALRLSIDHRNPGANTSEFPDNQSVGVLASISGNTLTLNTSGWKNNTAPVVYSK